MKFGNISYSPDHPKLFVGKLKRENNPKHCKKFRAKPVKNEA